MKKKIISIIAIAILLFGISAISASAETVASGTCGDNVTWTLDTEGTLTISGTGAMWNNSMPHSWRPDIKTVIIESGVSTIGDHTFLGCDSLTSITIPDSVIEIGDEAFDNCTSLTSITIPDSVTEIGDYAFFLCSNLVDIAVSSDNPAYLSDSTGVLYNKNKTTLICHPAKSPNTHYTIPDSVTEIGDYAFVDCNSLTSITIPNSVTTIGERAFQDCNFLTSITIPESVTTIGNYAFGFSLGLMNIEVASNNPAFSSDATGVLFDKNKTKLIRYPVLSVLNTHCTTYTIPETVTAISDHAFEACFYLTSITIPDSVTTIGEGAFSACNSLTSITIPNSVTTIGDEAFSNCNSLTSITIPDSVITIGDLAFGFCNSLMEIVVSSGNPAYSSDSTGVLFNKNKTTLIFYPYKPSNTHYTIPDSVTTIGDHAFFGCDSLTSIAIPNSVITIGEFVVSARDNLSCVEYEGSEEDWENIDIDYYFNSYLTSATVNYNSPIFGKNAMDNKISVTKTGDTDNWLFAIKLDKQTLDTDYAYVGIYNEYGNMITYARAELSSEGTANISIAKKLGADYAKVFVWRNVTPLAFFEKIDL